VALNILSSTVMIRLGKTHGPYMVDLRATNAKLRRRAVRITAALAGVTEAEAQAVLARADYAVKTAIVMLRLNLAPGPAGEKLRAAGGSLRAALKN
jgi:N-acetylmuramic acid 6-phosphate (MurNAc-6-P) etherase